LGKFISLKFAKLGTRRAAESLGQLLDRMLLLKKTDDDLHEGEGVPTRELLILHFNDVYSTSARKTVSCGTWPTLFDVITPRATPQDPVGGPTRFAAAIDAMKEDNPFVVFSGNALNPSISMCAL
jgi:hypothetical protein